MLTFAGFFFLRCHSTLGPHSLNMTAFLVKACRTFHLTNDVNWKNIKNRVEGVTFVDDRRAAMVFRGPAKKAETATLQTATTTILLGVNHHPGVRACSFYEPSRDGENGGHDYNHGDHQEAIVRSLVEAQAPGLKKNRITASSYELVVFRFYASNVVNVHRCYQILQRRDLAVVRDEEEPVSGREVASFVMDLELDDALYITHDRVVWSIADTVPQKILVSVEGRNPSEARELINKSRSMIGLF